MNEGLRAQLALLPDYLGNHLLLSMTALLLGLSISLPLAIAVTRVRALQGPVLGIASAIQTVPSLALLALMVPLLRQIGFVPALIALTLYSMLPVIRNTVTGIGDIDPALIEAGRGLGMTRNQLLLRIQLPLAMPVIIAGIRTAAVWVVGITTLSTPVGATSLGNYIFSGLQTQNYTAVLVGCAAAAGLALLLDGLIRVFEVTTTRGNRRRVGSGLAAIGVLLMIGIVPVVMQQRVDYAPVIVGSKTFTEQYILAALISDRLERAGIPTRTLESLGSTVAFDALLAGRIDVYVEYSGTIWANYMKQPDNPGAEAINAAVIRWLRDEHRITNTIPLGFENSYTLAVRRETAEQQQIATIDDLVSRAAGMTLGADYEFFSRPEWAGLQLKYGLDFRELVSMDPGLMYPALDAGTVDVITAFSTDGRIAAFDLVVLEDPREAFPPYDAVLLITPGESQRLEEVAETLAPLKGAISNRAMRDANRAVDIDGENVSGATEGLADQRNRR